MTAKQKREQNPPLMDEVLRRMLATPPSPHAQKAKKRRAKKTGK